ncbi:hypothetical protein [Maricaulis maris]|uniref:hypothetical protein n=1 Tax=Maricaulis maris TaxID=74318 RepID=UPI0026F23582|nr:hypothetical protein [Maricaulis maris]
MGTKSERIHVLVHSLATALFVLAVILELANTADPNLFGLNFLVGFFYIGTGWLYLLNPEIEFSRLSLAGPLLLMSCFVSLFGFGGAP